MWVNPPPDPDRPCGIYVIECREFVKIGITTNLEQRLKALEQANPFDLKTTLFCETTWAEARRIEKLIHDSLAEHHHRLEWFRVESIVAVKLVQEALKESGGNK